MNGSIAVWDWKRSNKVATIPKVKNYETYQSVFFSKKNGDLKGLIFLDDDGNLLEYDLITENLKAKKIIPECGEGNWKLHVDNNDTTDKCYVYEHNQAIIKCFDTHPY